jgi:hypothetical protein
MINSNDASLLIRTLLGNSKAAQIPVAQILGTAKELGIWVPRVSSGKGETYSFMSQLRSVAGARIEPATTGRGHSSRLDVFVNGKRVRSRFYIVRA